MSTPNIVLCRIDNRLVHGQVGVKWLNYSDANLLIVVDDQVAKDPIQQKIMKLTADNYKVQIRFFTIQHTADIIDKAAPAQRIFILTKTPHEMLELIKKGVPIEEVNVGNMHYSEGKKQISSRAYADEKNIEELKEIQSRIDRLYFQDYPVSSEEKVVL